MSGTQGTVQDMSSPAVTEPEKVVAWRMHVALKHDATVEIASRVATDTSIDLHEWARLVDKGCPPETAYEILARI